MDIKEIKERGSLIRESVRKAVIAGKQGAEGLVKCSKELDSGMDEVNLLLSKFKLEGDV